MKNKFIPVVLLASALLAACGNQNTTTTNETSSNQTEQSQKASSKEDLDDNTVAIVAGEKISKDDYKEEISFYASMLASQQQLKQSIVNMMVQDKLIENDIKKNNIEINDKEVDDSLMTAIQNSGGQEQFDKNLDDYNMDIEKFKETLRKDLVYTKHREWFEANNKPTDEEINKYFEENKDSLIKVDASHILVGDEKLAKEIKEKIDNGENFEELAKKYSEDTGSAANGGALGAFGKGQMVKEFEEVAFSLGEGEISDIVKSQYGYHIIKVNDIKDSVDDVKEEIIKALNDKKYSDYLKKLNEDSNVVTEFSVDSDEETPSTESENTETSNVESTTTESTSTEENEGSVETEASTDEEKNK